MSFEYESLLKYKTKVGKYEEIKGSQPSPQDRQKVYFTCHPDDFDKYFDEITNEVLSKQPNCAIYFYDGVIPTDEEDIDLDLNQMILFVIPVTYNFICNDNCQARKDFKYAEKNCISMLLLQQEPGLEEIFNQKCGDYQMLSKFPSLQNSQFYDPTAITYDEKLTKYLESRILGDELVKEIQQAFDAYIFLSYRKKDRKYAQELMKLIHSNDFCRDIAIWYDEFLVPGEDFNDAIKKAMEKSKLFSMVVTPNLINEANYVQSTEYPAAKESGKPMFPAESVPTDHAKLKELYPDIPDTVDTNGAEFSKELLNAIHKMAIKENDKDPKHNYLIGLAYLNGIDVEKDYYYAKKIIEDSAKLGLPEARKKFFDFIKFEYDYEYLKNDIENLISIYEKNTASIDDLELYNYYTFLGEYYYLHAGPYKNYEKAKNSFESAIGILKLVNENDKSYFDRQKRRSLETLYCYLGSIYRKMGIYENAEAYYIEYVKEQKIRADSEENSDSFNKYVSQDELFDLYFSIGEYEKAEQICKESIEYYLRLSGYKASWLREVSSYLNRLSKIYKFRKNNEEEKCLLLALKFKKRLRDEEKKTIDNNFFVGIVWSYEPIINYYLRENKIDKAKEFCDRMLSELKQYDYIVDEFSVFDNDKDLRVLEELSEIFVKIRDFDKSEKIIKSLVVAYKELSVKDHSHGYEKNYASCKYKLACIYYETNRINEAERELLQSLNLFINQCDFFDACSVGFKLAELYERIKRINDANEYYSAFTDSIMKYHMNDNECNLMKYGRLLRYSADYFIRHKQYDYASKILIESKRIYSRLAKTHPHYLDIIVKINHRLESINDKNKCFTYNAEDIEKE